ncbi:MAG: hypothetical protein ABI203_04630 [Mucilaginibacter sp.]
MATLAEFGNVLKRRVIAIQQGDSALARELKANIAKLKETVNHIDERLDGLRRRSDAVED